MAEKILPGENGSAVRIIIPGGSEDRRYLRYDDEESALLAQARYQSKWTPNFLARLLDDGMRTGPESVADYPTDEHAAVMPEVEAYDETLMHDTITAWRDAVADEAEEMPHAA